MTVDVARRRTRKPKTGPASESLAIGEIDQTVFACPDCARPLAIGAKRCPGCGTRLIMGVQARRAGMFVGAGVVAGLVFSFAFGATVSAISGMFQSADPAAVVVDPSLGPPPTPAATPVPTSSPATTGATSSVPALSRSALVQTAAVDARLATAATSLDAALSAPKFDTYGVSQILRATAGDAVVGLQLSAHIGAWSGGKQLSSELTAFYSAVQQTGAEGLSASIRNEKAYRAAAEKMLELLAGLDAVDGHVRSVATGAGVTIPPPGAAAP